MYLRAERKGQGLTFKTINKLVAGIAAGWLLSGCEAALNLEGVEGELIKSTLRTDQYQDMATAAGVTTVVGSQGLVLNSNDQGETWNRQIIDGKPDFIDLAVCPDNSLVALSFDRHIWVSRNQGTSWESFPLPTPEDVMAITCAPDNSFWAIGSFTTLLHSDDGGKNWDESSLNEDALLTHIQFFNDQIGIVAGEFGLLFKTTDGGVSWSRQGTIGQELYPLAAFFLDEQRGWVGGLSGTIMHTINGGKTWEKQNSGVPSPIYGFFGDGSNLFAVGDHGTVLTQQGDAWTRVQSPNIPVYLSSGLLLEENRLLVAGGWGAIFHFSPELSHNSPEITDNNPQPVVKNH